MSADTKTKAPPDAVAAITAFWAQWMEQSARGTQALLEAMQSAGEPKGAQQKWLDALSEQADSFMRTPAFMEMMRRNLKTMTDAKVAQDQMVHGAARHVGLPLAKDIDGLFERLHSSEQAILARLTAIEGRLASIEAQLAEANGAAPKKGRGGAPGAPGEGGRPPRGEG